MARNQFSVADYIVFGLTLLVSASIGVYYACTGGKQRTTQEFLMADRKMYVVPAALSLLASFMSAITLLGTPAEVYVFGTQYWLIGPSYIGVCAAAAHIFIPIFFKLKVTSAYEYLELRFSKGVRLLGSMVFSLQMILYMSIVLYAPALALNAVTGLNVWISVLTVGIVCTIYTNLGGIKAVMWTDTFQVFMMFAGLFAVLIQGSKEVGGFGKAWQIAKDSGRIQFWDFNPDPTVRHSVWSLVFGGFFTWLAIYGVNQAQVQRALTVPTLKQAQFAIWVNLPGLFALLSLTSMCGILIYAYYEKCDPLTMKEIMARDQLLPLFVMDVLGFVPGLPGVFVACLFSGALSTLSSGLNSLSAVMVTDLVRPYIAPNMSDEKATVCSKVIGFVYGVIMIGLTYVASQLGGVLQAALALFGMIGGPLLGIFTLGVFFPWANWKGAYAGLISGLICTFWVGIGAQIYKPIIPKMPVSIEGCPAVNGSAMLNGTAAILMNMTTVAATTVVEERPALASFYSLSYMWYSGFAVLIVVVIGLLVTACTGPLRADEVDPRLIFPVFDKMCRCMPEDMRRKFQCYVDHEGKWDEKNAEVSDVRENGYMKANNAPSASEISIETSM